HRGQATLPMRRIESLADDLHLFLSKAPPCRLLAPDQMVEDPIGVRIGNAEVALIRLPFDQIGRRRLGHDFVRYADMAGDRPNLRLEQVTERIDGRRVVAVPGE